MPLDSSRLAGITHLQLSPTRGPRDAFIFDPHRLALPSWALALGDKRGALLVTFDRHLDLVPPARLPPPSPSMTALEDYTRNALDVRNVDHILAAMELGLLRDAIVIARMRPQGAVDGTWTDSRGEQHQLLVVPLLDRLVTPPGERPVPQALEAQVLLGSATDTVLDFDLDCFTSPSDADPTTVLPWPRAVIREALRPAGSEPFWDTLLGKCRALTFAREPSHCGGLLASARLFEDAASVIFSELLGAELP
jgi:hypothetical protein